MGTSNIANRASIFKEVEQTFGLVPTWMKEVPEAALSGLWGTMRDFYLAETKIPNKYKELIGIAVSGATRCKYCTLFHTEGARLAGATDDEIAEASMMSGLTMLASTFINAEQVDYDVFREETLAIVDNVKKRQAKSAPAVHAHA
ncbi:MAG TPA: carboxymuconolactone decarboxylase family protein [Polyangiaceae bacterium]|nr:carboxymuconolactone decarboxylase family protein [Polyangiaceae bacterium]